MTGQCYNVYVKPNGQYVHGSPTNQSETLSPVLKVMRAAVLHQFPSWRCVGTAYAKKPVVR